LLLGIPVWEHLLGLGGYQVCPFATLLCALQSMQLLVQVDSCKGYSYNNSVCTILATTRIFFLSQHISECHMLNLLNFAMCSSGEGVADQFSPAAAP